MAVCGAHMSGLALNHQLRGPWLVSLAEQPEPRRPTVCTRCPADRPTVPASFGSRTRAAPSPSRSGRCPANPSAPSFPAFRRRSRTRQDRTRERHLGDGIHLRGLCHRGRGGHHFVRRLARLHRLAVSAPESHWERAGHRRLDASTPFVYSAGSLISGLVLGQCHPKPAVRPRRTSFFLPPSLLTAADARKRRRASPNL